jgi:hypothetical protein
MLGLTVWALPMMAACARDYDAADWRSCPGSTGLWAPGPELAECIARAGVNATETIQVGLGDSLADLRAHSSLDIGTQSAGVFFTDTPVDISWRDGERVYPFDDVGGTGQSILLINFSGSPVFPTRSAAGRAPEGVHSMSFAWQNRPLTAQEAVDRARRLHAWLEEGSYVSQSRSNANVAAFEVLDEDHRSTGRVFPDWPSAEASLSSDSENIQEIRFYALTSADTVVIVTATNMRRAALYFQDHGQIEPLPDVRRTIFDGNGGYEWLLEVSIGPAELSAQESLKPVRQFSLAFD